MPIKKSASKPIRLVYLKQYLERNTNEKKAVSKDKIEQFYRDKELGVPDRKTFYEDINTLNTYFGLDIEYSRAMGGYFIRNPKFKLNELRLMIDSVQSAKFITENEAKNLTKKIAEFAEEEAQEKLKARKATVNDRVRNANKSILEATDVIYRAITADAKIEFKYVHYSPSREDNNKKYVKSGEKLHVSPFAVYWNDGNYYLYAYNSDLKKPAPRTYRIDRMEEVSYDVHDRREGHKECDLSKKKDEDKGKVFNMYQTGNVKPVQLICINSLADQIVDTFGKDISLHQMPDDKDHFFVLVNVDLAPTFYAWVATFGKKMRITTPHEAVKGMKEFLDKAASAYKSKEG